MPLIWPGPVMDDVNKYLKIAKDAVIEPAENIEDKIIDRISHIGEKDKELLDDKYQDFFKKTNSRVYQFNEKVRNNPGAVAGLAVTISLVLLFIAYIIKILFGDENSRGGNNRSSSSKSQDQENQGS